MYSVETINTNWVYKYQEKLIEKFLKIKITTKLIKSPFREDKNPTCGFYYSKNGILYLHDFATGTHFDVFQIGMRCMLTTKQDLVNYIISIKHTLEESTEVDLTRDYNYEYIPGDDKGYFDRYFIPRIMLSKYGVEPARAIYIDGVLSSRATKGNPIYVYKHNDRFKIYRPLSPNTDKKWGGNLDATCVSGWNNLPSKGDICFITSSLKDVMVLKILGYNAIAFQGEGYGLSNKTMKIMNEKVTELRSRFKHILLFLDNDNPGIANANKLCQIHKLLNIYLPIGYPKDISDYIFKYGISSTSRRMKKLLSRKFRVDEFPF